MGHTEIIGKLQWLTAKLTMGAFRSSNMDTLEVLANLPPVQLCLAATCHHEALHLFSLPSTHPLHLHVHKAAKLPPRFHHSPIHNLLHTFALRPTGIETIDPICQHLSW